MFSIVIKIKLQHEVNKTSGRTEFGEALETTTVREVKEEMGLDIKELNLLATASWEDCFIEFSHGDKAFL